MCEGTRCTHHVNPIVQEVEEEYDSWIFRHDPFFDADPTALVPLDEMEPSAYIISVVGRNQEASMSHGPSHDQPMITFKDDVGRMHSDDDARRYLYCTDCSSGGHRCYGCSVKVPHMAEGRCPACLERYDNEFAQRIRNNL